jgi:hypothetical protein
VIGGGLSGAGAASQLGFNVSELLPLVSVMAAALGLVF